MGKFFLESLIPLFVVFISGNPAVNAINQQFVYAISFLVLLCLSFIRKIQIIWNDVLVFLLFFIVFLYHLFSFGELVVFTSIGFFVKLSIAFLVVRVVPNWSERYVSIMYVLSIISFVFYIPLFLGVDMQGIFSVIRVPLVNDEHFSILIHNLRIEYDGAIRNMGMFWEPGAFSGYLIVALLLLIRDGIINSIAFKKFIVISLAILSTQSTTGYSAFVLVIALFFQEVNFYKEKSTKIIVNSVVITSILVFSFFSFNKFEFLGDKINLQFESAMQGDMSSRINRFGNFLYDIDWIEQQPLFGWSVNPQVRNAIDPEVEDLLQGQGNGLTGFIIQFGLIGIIIYFLFFMITCRSSSTTITYSFFGVIILSLLLMGEKFLNFPIFLSLMFSQLSKNDGNNLTNNAI